VHGRSRSFGGVVAGNGIGKFVENPEQFLVLPVNAGDAYGILRLPRYRSSPHLYFCESLFELFDLCNFI